MKNYKLSFEQQYLLYVTDSSCIAIFAQQNYLVLLTPFIHYWQIRTHDT
jgi:hypothetical protein